MARIRTIKPELFTDRKLAGCSISARWTFAGLLTESDDKGRQRYSAAKLVGTLYEHDHFAPKKLHGWVLELEREGIVHFYEDTDGTILCIPHFLKHQVVSKPSKSRLIPCPQNHNTLETPQEVPGDALESPGETQGTVRGDPGTEVGTRKLEVGTEEIGSRNGLAASRRDPAWDAFLEVCSINGSEMSEAQRSKVGAMLKSLRQRHQDLDNPAIAAEIRRRAANHDATYGIALSDERLMGKWAELGKARPPRPFSALATQEQPGERLKKRAAEARQREESKPPTGGAG